MISLVRYKNNPLLSPNKDNWWESYAVLNPSVIKKDGLFYMLYRAISDPHPWQDAHIRLSSIGLAKSDDGLNFTDRKQFLIPEYDWERFGCEDPRVVFIDGTYLIFYTALSTNPPSVEGIKVGVALSRDLEKITERHLVTPFNAKAMTLFPEKINGKYVAILTVDTDRPPAKIAIATFDNISALWDKSYWEDWYDNLSNNALALQRRSQDQVEVGLSPIKTKVGWLLVYSYIQNYYTDHKVFGVEAALLDSDDPRIIYGKTNGPFMVPTTEPEKYGKIPNIIFPSGGLVQDDKLTIYYGASDTTICAAEISIQELINQIVSGESQLPIESIHSALHLVRFDGNPILTPISSHKWEEESVLNAGIFKNEETTYILYRAMNKKMVSSIGLATTIDGYHINERLPDPVYVPRAEFEINPNNGPAGCEDPRITRMGDNLYMLYTGYDGKNSRVIKTQISVSDFLNRKWTWEEPVALSDPGVMDKNSALFPEKIDGKLVILHRLDKRIWIDKVNDFSDFSSGKWLLGKVLAEPRAGMWDSEKVGIAGPPIKTDLGWILLYHGISIFDNRYRLGVMVLDIKDPTKVLVRLDNFILEPKLPYEMSGVRPGAVFSCGFSLIEDKLFVYYGAADSSLAVAQTPFALLRDKLRSSMDSDS